MPHALTAIASAALLVATSGLADASGTGAARPVDLSLDQNGDLPGRITGDAMATVNQNGRRGRLLVFCGRRLVAQTAIAGNGAFRVGGLRGGLYWVSAALSDIEIGQAIRAWSWGTAPPKSDRSLVLGISSPPSPKPTDSFRLDAGSVIRGQSPVAAHPVLVSQMPYGIQAQQPGFPIAAQPLGSWSLQVPGTPAYPFQPYGLPGGGMVLPGPYTSPGAVFISPLVTAAVVTGVAGVIFVALDDDDDNGITVSQEVQSRNAPGDSGDSSHGARTDDLELSDPTPASP